MVRFFSYIYAITCPKPTPKFPVNSLQLELLGTARDLFDWDEPSIAPSYIVSGHLTHELKSMFAVCIVRNVSIKETILVTTSTLCQGCGVRQAVYQTLRLLRQFQLVFVLRLSAPRVFIDLFAFFKNLYIRYTFMFILIIVIFHARSRCMLIFIHNNS